MLKGRGRDPRAGIPVTPAHLAARPPAQAHLTVRGLVHRAPLAKAEPDYEVVEFPSEQYVNAKLQPPPPPPPRPPTGHPADAGASCGLCGGGGARVRCAECGRRALCASCDDMYHRHPKRRHHQRQALPPSQLRDELPPLPPKVTPPVPPPRRHKLSGDRSSASPRPSGLEQRRATLGHMTLPSQHQPTNKSLNNNATVQHPIPAHLQRKLAQQPTAGHPNHLGMQSPVGHVGSMPYLNMPHAAPMAQSHAPAGTLGHLSAAWGQPRGSLTPFNMHQNVVNMVPSPAEAWESPDSMSPPGHASPWGRPLRRGASVLELGAGGVVCGGCAHCSAAAPAWRYGSCASLDHAWPGAWPHAPPHPPPCCQPQHPHNMHAHQHGHTPQPYRRVDSRAVSRAASRPCSRAASPAASVRSRASRRARHRTPSPPPLPSSDADSESDSDSPPHNRDERRISHSSRTDSKREPSLGPAPPPPAAAWHCEHCTYVNEPGVRVCAVCCRTPTAAPNFTVNVNMSRLRVADNDSPSPVPTAAEEPRAKQNGEATKQRPVRERASTGCGPSPPREETPRKPVNRLVTPTREPEQARTRHDMAVGPSPPRDHNMATGPSPPREPIPVRASPYRELQRSPPAPPTRHSVSVGPSPPRDTTLRPTVSVQVQKKSTGTSPPREAVRETPPSTRANVSNTGTSPPPQSISTQTYEAGGGVGAGPGAGWERAPSASRSRPRRRPRDPARRERSHSRHSLSSDTRVRALPYRDVTATSQESERSVRTSVGGGGSSGRWEWRETRDSSPGGEWSDGERRRLTRRASHLDLRRARQPAARRASFYGSEAASPEPLSSTRTLSLEALAGAGARREAERGLELARLMTDAERLGFSAAEVHAALAQNPTAPLSWLRERWPSLCAGVRAAAARLAPGVAVTELEARAALARHRGAMWPAVTECVERHRRQVEAVVVGEEGRLRGRVWGSPAGADDDAAPPARRTHRARAEDSSDEFEATTPNKLRDDDWMYLPLEPSVPNPYDIEPNPDVWSKPQSEIANGRDDIANKLKSFLIQAGVPSIDENLLLKGLLADSTVFNTGRESNDFNENYLHNKPQPNDLVQSEIDFIDAYNSLTRLSPLPNIKNPLNLAQISKANSSLNLRQEERSLKDLHTLIYNREKHNEIASKNNFRSNQSQEQLNLKVPDLNKLEGRQQDNEPKEIESATDLHVEEHAVIVNRNVRDEQPKTRSRENTPKENIPNTTKRELVPHTVIANNRVSPEQSVKKPSTSSNPRNSTNVPENTPKTSHREDERTNNLSDIVDDTQRLIQQMKEEINSDINSLDGRSMSQSEPDNSSNDDLSTEHESSSSESHEETDDISSDENETSGTEEDSKHSKKSGTVVNRTSSEDNEQFEEAMDHIEEQNENFKQTNIEILNSIARSLQEEHTISVRASQTEEPNATQIKETKQSNQSRPPAPKLSKTKVQDLNNNLFAVVNSFEEIYDEINSSSGNEYKNTDQQKTGKIESTERTSTLPQTPRVNIERRDIEILLFTPISPTKLIIDERELPVLNAIIENIEEPLEITEYDSLENHTSNIAENLEEPPNYLFKNNAINAKESDITLVTLNNDQLDSYSDNIHGNSQYRGFSGNEHNIEDNAHYDSHNVSLVKENGQSLETNNEAHHDINNIIDNRALTDKDNGFDHNEESNMNEQIYHIQEPNLNNSEEIYHIGAKEKSKSPEKSISGSPNSGGKISAMAKSSIPKLIRILPNNKQKFDKTPKVIASKVPIRRGSIKQYPAPTPPKTHFGNIQSGLVKQLQTRLFNSKATKVTANPSTTEEIKSTPSHSATVEVKASTSSTLNKKRPAPQPPSRLQEIKQPSPPQASPPKEKKNYFRETCRTEDEWTESDSEDSQLQIRKGDDEPQRVPSPPPPITLRRVSGQLIDLARVRLLEGSPERQARMLLAEGAAESWEQAQLAVELVSRGADPPAALLAALECADLNAALAYLYQDCELCASRFPEHEMVSMLRCTHRCCRECARHYFTVQVTERSIVDCVCPYCKEPELETLPEDAWLEYFAHLDILLKMLLEVDVHELFQRKLRDRTLARDPNFRWCVECSSGFFVHPKQKKLRCPECKSVSCATCRKPWSSNHEGLSCEQYAAWLEDNDPERSVAAVQQHLRENGLECPRCRFKYSLSRGGCMHFTCTQCKFEFCYGCGKPFMMGARCGLSEYCAKLGLHAHHPRNCLFYLRDKEPHELQTLLQMNDVSYETELAVESGAGGGGGRCPVQLQRETPAGLVDGACGSEVAPKHAGLCKNHYLEYLSRVVRARGVDPLPLLGVDDLETLVRRAALRLPPRPYGTLEGLYKRALTEIVKEKIPLD